MEWKSPIGFWSPTERVSQSFLQFGEGIYISFFLFFSPIMDAPVIHLNRQTNKWMNGVIGLKDFTFKLLKLPTPHRDRAPFSLKGFKQMSGALWFSFESWSPSVAQRPHVWHLLQAHLTNCGCYCIQQCIFLGLFLFLTKYNPLFLP